MSRLLALDQASHTTGYAIFINGKFSFCGKFTFDDSDLGIRLLKIRNKIKDIIQENNIDEVILEDIQLQDKNNSDSSSIQNIKTFKILAEVFGNVYELLTELGIKNDSVLAVQWRSTLGIEGKTRPQQKKNAQLWVKNIYGITPTEDECDAICIGNHYLLTKLNKNFKAKVKTKSSQKHDIEGYSWD